MRKKILIILSVIFASCSNPQQAENKTEEKPSDTIHIERTDSVVAPTTIIIEDTICKLEQQLIDAGLVDIQTVNPNILVDLRYSSTNNFLGIDMYGCLERAYFQPEVAFKVSNAAKYLAKFTHNRRLLILDAARPHSVQQILWDSLDMPLNKKRLYVAPPEKISLHNYGVAVDMTIADENGNELDMGTAFDYFGELAYPKKAKELHEAGKLTDEQMANRRLLDMITRNSGLRPIAYEWWHFNAMPRVTASKKYKVIE